MSSVIRAVLAAALMSVALAQKPLAVGDWHLNASSSSMLTHPERAPASSSESRLEIACVPNGTLGIQITLYGSSLITNRLTGVTYRVDSGTAVTQTWAVEDNVHVSPGTPEDAQELIAAMLAGAKIAIQYIAYTSSPTFVFPISGLRESLHVLGCYTGPL